jgi:hypothetical protein
MTDFEALLAALNDAGVKYIVIGGVAGILHGAARVTYDLDILYERSPENYERLAKAFSDLDPYLRGAPPGLPFSFDERTISRGLNFTLTTSLGDVDVLGEVPGDGRYERLRSSAVVATIGDLEVPCVALNQLVQLKRAAGRPKDLEAIAELDALLDES